jgi:hypothetical protein
MVAKTSDEEQVDRALIESYDLCMANGTNLTQSEAVHFVSQNKIAFPATAGTPTGSVGTPTEKPCTSGTPMPLSDGDRQTEFDVFRTTTQVSIQKVLKKAANSGSPSPSDTNGVPFYLAYDIRGLCYTNCSRHRGKGSKTQHRA